jgi:hypothetical protein
MRTARKLVTNYTPTYPSQVVLLAVFRVILQSNANIDDSAGNSYELSRKAAAQAVAQP